MKDEEFMSQKAAEMTVKELKAAIKIKKKEQSKLKKDIWNLADNTGYTHEEEVILIKNFKTFIQKVKGKKYVYPRGASFQEGVNAALEEIDKRTGEL